MFGGGGSQAQATKPASVPTPAPTAADTSVVEAGQKTRSASKAGVGSTVATGSGGLTTPATTTQKSLLGD
jgi:hypothetical protein